MEHATEIEYEGNLVEDIGNLRYDALAKFLTDLSEKLYKDGFADFQRERVKLANRLFLASGALSSAADEVEAAWKISKPYMK